MTVGCTAGTYIRAIARDAGAALGVGGHLTALRRTASGPFAIDAGRAGRGGRGGAGRRRRDGFLRLADAATTVFPPRAVTAEEAGRHLRPADPGHRRPGPARGGRPRRAARRPGRGRRPTARVTVGFPPLA